MNRKLLRWMLVVVGVLALAGGGWTLFQYQQGYANAMELAQFGLWPQARREMSRYLRLHPDHAEANFIMSEFWVNDEGLTFDEIGTEAIAHLERIPDDSSFAADARTQQGKLRFLLLHQPVVAEQLLRRAIELDEQNVEPYRWLSTVMEMTERWYQTESYFWEILERSPPETRSLVLREWYMSQFFPLTHNQQWDERMGFTEVATDAIPVEAVRYLRFRETEPDQPLARAALARWTRRTGKPSEALDLLAITDENTENEFNDPFFVATLIDLLIDLGEYERAAAHFREWPGAKEGFDYWRINAMILEEVEGKFDEALESYELAITTWPGPADWRLLHRKAGCLAQAGKRDEAVETRKRAGVIEKLMEDDVHERLRYILGFLDNPDHLLEVAEFYRKLGRPQEFNAWTEAAAMVAANRLE